MPPIGIGGSGHSRALARGRGFSHCVTTESCPPSQRVSEGALSPDGTVLATASHDGHIKFWQMYIEAGQDKPR